jgi:uncharacterized protein with PQ loop repeat
MADSGPTIPCMTIGAAVITPVPLAALWLLGGRPRRFGLLAIGLAVVGVGGLLGVAGAAAVAVAAAVLEAAMGLPQAWTAVRSATTDGISRLTWTLQSARCAIWIAYGVGTGLMASAASSLVLLPAALTVLVATRDTSRDTTRARRPALIG